MMGRSVYRNVVVEGRFDDNNKGAPAKNGYGTPFSLVLFYTKYLFHCLATVTLQLAFLRIGAEAHAPSAVYGRYW